MAKLKVSIAEGAAAAAEEVVESVADAAEEVVEAVTGGGSGGGEGSLFKSKAFWTCAAIAGVVGFYFLYKKGEKIHAQEISHAREAAKREALQASGSAPVRSISSDQAGAGGKPGARGSDRTARGTLRS